jgi:hypothetical protein
MFGTNASASEASMGIFNSAVLDVAIGLVFVYLLLAIMCTAVNEWILAALKVRSKLLEKGIKQLLDNQPAAASANPSGGAAVQSFVDAFYAHPVITGMMRDGSHPSYLSSRTFSTAIMDLATAGKQGTITFQDLESGLKAFPDGDVKKAMLSLMQDAEGDLKKARQNIEAWFDDAMDRVSGWFKRRTQVWTVVVAMSLTLVANADTFNIVHQLYTNPTVRSAVSESLKARLQTAAAPNKPVVTPPEGNPLTQQESALLGQMIGWSSETIPSGAAWAQRILGWILTAIAVSLGAPFWFDTLNRFMNVRGVGKSPDEPAKKS